MRCSLSCLYLLSVWVGALNGSVALGQFQLDIEQLAETSYVQDVQSVEQKPQHNNGMFDVRQNIDGWVFNQHGNARKAKEHLNNSLSARVESLGKLFELTAAQKEKLQLAGRGDIAAFFSEYEAIRSKYDGEIDQQRINEVWGIVQPLQQRMQKGLFARDSMLAKISKRTLNDEQLEVYATQERERLKYGYRAAIKLAIAEVEKSAPLMASQRKRIVQLLAESECPKTLGQHIQFFILFRLSESSDELKKILRPEQLEAIQPALDQGANMRQFLQQNGFID